ncbi:chain-length determining protein [Xanthomonas sp. A2111]|uniref:Wzz/FepE/Etk N-terminal domain-containing protein n=1 Tax=Xanthomonas hawaiiensis TaxID=3003247 RepID=A0ABU2HZ44_9XANT|nr:Wzz/FepE/Etk N-terminal domain-containing protein [Xanthomonas sp. A2111]MBO9830309.1 chain-length determining protein [Xanthomonas sp. A2111]MDS9991168.1 Wzz/FepE/Etk N-terminal domain-containing protein [Xanthomonas sp. A2111]
MPQDEIYLLDLWRILRREWRWCLLPLLLALALAALFLHGATRQWQATAWVQVGEFGPTPSGRDPKLEPFQRVIDRIKTRQFQEQVLHSVGVASDSRQAALYRDSLKLDPDPYANLIQLTLRAQSPQQARQLATATIAQLQALHRRIQAGPLQQASARLQELAADIAATQAERERLLVQQREGRGSAEQQLLGNMLLSEKTTTLRGLKAEREDLLGRLGARYTYDTSAPWETYVPPRAAFPNPVLVLAAALLAGLGGGVLAAVVRNALRRRQARPSQAHAAA